MKQKAEFINERPSVRLVLLLWKKYKGYDDCFPHLGHLVEILSVFSRNHTKDNSDGRFFDNLLLNEESSLGWMGSEPIDILSYETASVIKQRLTHP